MNDVISIKGIRDSLLVTVGSDCTWEQAERELLYRIERQGDFFHGAQITLQVGDLTLERDDIRRLQAKLQDHDVKLSALLGTSPDTIRAARRLEVPTEVPEEKASQPEEVRDLPPIDDQEHGEVGMVVKMTLRSGRIVKHAGHVIVIGDVNPGAQIIAGGDVLVWGRLRGTVHAGATGDDTAMVCALDMRPTQLRIANLVAIAGDNGKPRPSPEIAFVRDGQIVAEEWGT